MVKSEKTNLYLLGIVAVIAIIILISKQEAEVTSPEKIEVLNLLSSSPPNYMVVYQSKGSTAIQTIVATLTITVENGNLLYYEEIIINYAGGLTRKCPKIYTGGDAWQTCDCIYIPSADYKKEVPEPTTCLTDPLPIPRDAQWKAEVLETIKEREAEGYPINVISFTTTLGRTCYHIASEDMPVEEGVGVRPGEVGIYCFREDGLIVTKTSFGVHAGVTYVEGYPVDAETEEKLEGLYYALHSS